MKAVATTSRPVLAKSRAERNPVEERLLLKPRDAARILSISERTLWGSGIPKIRIGKRGVRYSIDDLRDWIVQRTESGAQKTRAG